MQYLDSFKTPQLQPNWALWEGLRELIQNCLLDNDGTVEFNNGTLTFTNKDLTLDRSILGDGFTTKREDETKIGCHGDGYLSGLLALVRAGHEVRIYNGTEQWTPRFRVSEALGIETLQIAVTKLDVPSKDYVIKVSDITKKKWLNYQRNFLSINPPKKNVRSCFYGSVLMSKMYKGKIFVKGIYVMTDEGLTYGYDLAQGVQVNRDRSVLSHWDVQYNVARIMSIVAPQCMDVLMKLLETGAPDLEKLEYFIEDEFAEKVTEQFHKRYGEDAIAVGNIEQAKQAGFHGKTGIVVPQALRQVVETHMGSLETVIRKQMNKPIRYIQLSEMALSKGESLYKVLALVENLVGPLDVKIVKFPEQSRVLGTFCNGEICLAYKILDDEVELLYTLVHEYCHNFGRDGEVDHERAIGHMLAKIALKEHAKE